MRYDPRELTDEELVARSHEELYHVTRAYEELMRRYQRTLFNVCARYLGNDRDADDVCQEVMLKVLYGLKNFEGKSSSRPGSTASPTTSALPSTARSVANAG